MRNTALTWADREFWLDHPAANKEHLVKRTYIRSKSPHALSFSIEGNHRDVVEHVAWLIQTDTCTPMYEHMLMRVTKLDFAPGGTAVATIYKSLYAGD